MAKKVEPPIPPIPTAIVPSVRRSMLGQSELTKEFRKIVDTCKRFHVAGQARKNPKSLLTRKLMPKHKIELFGTRFYFTDVIQIPELRFFLGYVVQNSSSAAKPIISARIFYKDLSLSWRVASHFTFEDDSLWIGKGDVRDDVVDGDEIVQSNESTTDLPLEMQTAVESLLGSGRVIKGSQELIDAVLRRGPNDRVEPYQDFVAPRLRAQSDRRNLINRDRSVAVFKRKNDPSSLKFTKGFEPDLRNGVVEKSRSRSKLYGGVLRRYRILSTNKSVHYYFFAGGRHVWVLPPQATTVELSSYGVRTIDVQADDDMFIPGWEYHHYEETKNGVELYSQIPPGFAGEVCPLDDAKADAGPWLDKIPIIKQFRKQFQKRG